MTDSAACHDADAALGVAIRLTDALTTLNKVFAMPTYGYVCDKCGHEFETFQSISADALTTCPADLCGRKRWGKGKVKRTIGAGAGLLFKGSGFYITDYRSEGYKQAAKKDSASGSKPSTSGETKTPAKSKAETPKPSSG